MEQYFLDIANFNKKEHELVTSLDKWMYVLKNMSRLKEMPESLKGDPVFEQLFEAASVKNLNDEELEAYRESLKRLRDEFGDTEVTGIKVTILKI